MKTVHPGFFITILIMVFFSFSQIVTAKTKVQPGDSIEKFGLGNLDPQAGTKFVHTDDFIGSSAKTPSKALILSFFASWCKPCKEEIPVLKTYFEKYNEKGLSILLVNIDREVQGRADAMTFINTVSPPFPVLSDKFNLVTRRYFDSDVNLPAILMFDEHGKLSLVHHGSEAAEMLKVEQKIRDLLQIAAEPDNQTGKKTKKTKKKHKKKRKKVSKNR